MRVRTLAIAALLTGAMLPLLFGQDTEVRPKKKRGNPIDHYFNAKWRELDLKPARRSTDSEFLRRVTLDITGTIPKPEEVEIFLAKGSSSKRGRKIDELLESDAWKRYWADRLAGILVGYRDRLYPAVGPIKSWLKEQLGSRTPYDRIVTDLITATGQNDEEDSTAFVLQYMARDRSKKALTVQVAKVFLGIQLQCAQCHDHPFEQWKKSDFDRMVAFFGTTNIRVVERMERNRESKVAVIETLRPITPRDPAEPNQRRRRRFRQPPKPKFIDGTVVEFKDARRELARMITSPSNLQFARATVNRVWADFFGRGFVEPIDDFNSKNEPAFPDLLDTLAALFVESNFDLRWLMRTLATSRAYQLSSNYKAKKNTDLDALKDAYAMQIVRPMVPEQSVNVLQTAQGVTSFAGRGRGAGRGGYDREQFFRQRLLQQFVLGSGTENSVSPSEYNASMQQVMSMLNMDAPFYRGIGARGTGRLAKILNKTRRPDAVIHQLFLATLSRPPEPRELAECKDYWKKHGRNDQAFEDIFFVLLNTNEFFFNH